MNRKRLPSDRSEPSRRRISPLRSLALLGSLGAVMAGSAWAVGEASNDLVEQQEPVPFAPYVDVTLTPVEHFEDPTTNAARDVTLGFVVADPEAPCTPTWGTYYDLDAAGRALDLDRRVARLVESGGSVTVSFGGEANEELAVACTDVDELADAYRSVIDRYEVTSIDLDIEGPALDDAAASARRAEALAQIQDEPDETESIDVWLTLPVDPQGLTEAGEGVLDVTLGAGVRLAGVNAMTMNYGESRSSERSMGQASVDALEALQRQVVDAHSRVDVELTDDEAWRRVGATPMIGQNDVATDRFDLDDARRLIDHAGRVGLGRLSMWSLNRDGPCGPQWNAANVSNTCSGVDQDDGAFSALFLEQAPPASGPGEPRSSREVVVRDDPATSPYPIWQQGRVYEQGDKVVWHGGVYEAKWYAQGDLPDEPVEDPWDSPWRLIGPVLAGDAEVVASAATETAGDVPARWNADAVYLAGDPVRLGNDLFVASWWTQGDRPEVEPSNPYDHPWEHLGEIDPDRLRPEAE